MSNTTLDHYKDPNKLDLNNTYKHGPIDMLNELSEIELLWVGHNLVVYRYVGSVKERSTGMGNWLEWVHIVGSGVSHSRQA